MGTAWGIETPVAVGAWTWAQPGALALLALPVLLLVFSLRRARPRSVPLGTLRFMGAQAAAEGGGRRWRVPASRWFAILALVAAALGLAGPAPGGANGGGDPRIEVYTARVDRSPSMGLPVDPDQPDGPTRLDAAVAELQRWARAAEGEGRRVLVRWTAADGPVGTGSASDSPSGEAPVAVDPQVTAPGPWLGSSSSVAEPTWAGLARAGEIWLTDRVPVQDAGDAGWFASGGSKVPGLVAVGAGGSFEWDGSPDSPLAPLGSVSQAAVTVEGELPAVITDFAGAWAGDRLGVGLTEGSADSNLMLVGPAELRAGGAGPSETVGRDGWFARVRRQPVTQGTAGLTPWLTDAAGNALIAYRPGRVEFSVAELEPTAGPDQAAAFAVSFAGLLDSAMVPPAGVVSVQERADAGPAGSRPPGPRGIAVAAEDHWARVDAIESRRRRDQSLLLLAAGCLAGLAAFLRLRADVR